MKDRFDQLLHETLRQITDAEPLHGIEERISARALRATRVRRLIWCALPLSACSAMSIAWLALHSSQTVTPKKMAAIIPQTQVLQRPPEMHADTPSVQIDMSTHTATAVRPHPKAGTGNDLPKLDTFPGPPEDTPERRAVLALTEPKNQPALLAAADLQKQQANSIEIAEIQIKPLTQETQP